MRKVNESEVEWIIRGGAGLSAPENTIAALDVGQSLGVRHVWLDLQISRDGVPFFLRDKLLSRSNNLGTGVLFLLGGVIFDSA